MFGLQFFVVEVYGYYFVVEIWIQVDVVQCVDWDVGVWCIDCDVVVICMFEFDYVVDVWVVWQQFVFDLFYCMFDDV